MRELGVREKRIIQTGVEGLMTLLLVVTAFIKSVKVMGIQVKISYPIMIGALLRISDIPGIGELAGDDWKIFLFYTAVLTLIYVLCVFMVVCAWRGKGRIIYITGNAVVIILVLFLNWCVGEINKNMTYESDALHVGLGYWIAFILALAGLVLGIMNIRRPWIGKSAGRGMAGHISRPGGVRVKERFDKVYSSVREKAAARHVNRPVWEDGVPAKSKWEPEEETISPERGGRDSSVHEATEPAAPRHYTGEEKPAASRHYTEEEKAVAPRHYAVEEKDVGETGKVRYHLKNNGAGGEDSGYFRRDEDDDLL